MITKACALHSIDQHLVIDIEHRPHPNENHVKTWPLAKTYVTKTPCGNLVRCSRVDQVKTGEADDIHMMTLT